MALREARRVLDPISAEDAAQQALLRAWKYRARAPAGDPAPWIRVIARREALRNLGLRRELVAEETLESRPDVASDQEHALQHLVAIEALRALPEKERVALLLHYWGDLSQPSIAAALNVPLGTIKVRIHRAQAKLSYRLEKPGARPPVGLAD